MLPAAVQQRHDHVDPVGLPLSGLDQPLQVLVMVVRRHVVFVPKQIVGAVIVAHIHQDKQVRAPDGGFDDALAVAGGEPGALRLDPECLFIAAALSAPLHQVLVNLRSKALRAVHHNEPQWRDPVLPVKNCIG